MSNQRLLHGSVACELGRFCGGLGCLLSTFILSFVFHSTFRLNVFGAFLMLNLMVERQSPALDRVFGALSDPTRRAMLRRLSGGTRTVGELAEPFDMSFAAAAKHVKVLEEAGLLRRTIEGRTHRCRIEAGPLAQADRWLAYYERFWSLRLDDLERALVRHSGKRSRK
jgi:DNA-binding transcriptional ArsR family regulator